MDFNGDRIETYYVFDNYKGDYYYYLEIDEDIVRKKNGLKQDKNIGRRLRLKSLKLKFKESSKLS